MKFKEDRPQGVSGLVEIARWHMNPKEVFEDIHPLMVEASPERIRRLVEQISEINLVNNSSQPENPLAGISPEDASLLLDQITFKARRIVEKSQGKPIELLNMRDTCGFVSATAYLMMEDAGIEAKSVNLGDIIPNKYLRHEIAITSLPIKNTDGTASRKHYVLDLSFKQFCTVADLAPAYFIDNRPTGTRLDETAGYYFNQTREGQKLAVQILTRGYFELTPENARIYLDCYNESPAVFSDAQIYVRAITGAPHDCDFDLEELHAMGYEVTLPGGKYSQTTKNAQLTPPSHDSGPK